MGTSARRPAYPQPPRARARGPRSSRGTITLWHLLTLIAFSGGVSAACQLALSAGDDIAAVATELLAGFAAGLATYFAAGRVGRRLEARAPGTPDQAPTLRSELPFLLLYLGAFAGVTSAIVAAAWLVRLAFQHIGA